MQNDFVQMKFSYNWIREMVPGLDLAPRDLMHLITTKTAEFHKQTLMKKLGVPVKPSCCA